jgi:hypothetical protein
MQESPLPSFVLEAGINFGLCDSGVVFGLVWKCCSLGDMREGLSENWNQEIADSVRVVLRAWAFLIVD